MLNHVLIRPARLKIAERRREIKTNTCKMPGQKCREADHQPFGEIERLKKNLLRQLERFTKWFKDFDFLPVAIHDRHLEWFLPVRAIRKMFGARRIVTIRGAHASCVQYSAS